MQSDKFLPQNVVSIARNWILTCFFLLQHAQFFLKSVTNSDMIKKYPPKTTLNLIFHIVYLEPTYLFALGEWAIFVHTEQKTNLFLVNYPSPYRKASEFLLLAEKSRLLFLIPPFLCHKHCSMASLRWNVDTIMRNSDLIICQRMSLFQTEMLFCLKKVVNDYILLSS